MAYRGRGNTPLGAGPPPTLEASNQAQIEDLVQRNRTLEQLHKKLQAQFDAEVARGKEALHVVQAQHAVNQQQWKEGCEDLLAAYRIVQKRLELEIERERGLVIKEMEVTREEKLQRMKRDFKLILFKMKEEDSERKIGELIDEKFQLGEEYETLMQVLEEKYEESVMEAKEAVGDLARLKKEKTQIESKLNKLRETHANLDAEKDATKTTMERIQLQLEGSLSKISDLERANDDLRRTNADLNRQLERWQSLEGKEGKEVESQRKKRVALERQLQEMKEEYEAQAEQDRKALEREQKRSEKFKNASESRVADLKETQAKLDAAEKEIAKMKKQNSKLKDDLEVERLRVRPPSPQKPSKSHTVDDVVEEVQSDTETARKTKVTKRSASKQPTRRSAQPKKEESDNDSASEPEEEDMNRKPKSNAKTVGPKAKTRPPKPKAKRKTNDISEDEEDAQAVESAPTKKGPKSNQATETGAKARTKPASRAGSRKPMERKVEDSDQVEEESDVPKKKKRKINLFPTNDKGSGLILAQFADPALNIPSVLSPLKPEEAVPQRSTSSGLISNLGSLFLGRRG